MDSVRFILSFLPLDSYFNLKRSQKKYTPKTYLYFYIVLTVWRYSMIKVDTPSSHSWTLEPRVTLRQLSSNCSSAHTYSPALQPRNTTSVVLHATRGRPTSHSSAAAPARSPLTLKSHSNLTQGYSGLLYDRFWPSDSVLSDIQSI